MTAKNFSSNFFEKVLQTWGVMIVTQVLFVGISIVGARMLGPAGKGEAAILMMYPVMLATLGHLSIYRAVTVHVAEKKFNVAHFPLTLAGYTLAVTCAAAAVFFIMYTLWPAFSPRYFNPLVVFGAVYLVPMLILNQMYSSVLEACGRVTLVNFKEITFHVVLFTATILFLVYCKLGVKGVIAAYLLAHGVVSLQLIWFMRRQIPTPWKFDGFLLRCLLADGSKVHIAVIAQFILMKLNVLILGQYRFSAYVGYYTIASSVAELLLLIPMAVQAVFYANLSTMMENKEDMVRRTLIVCRHGVYLYLCAAGVLISVAPALIRLFYGESFLPSLQLFYILLPGVFCLCVVTTLTNYLMGMKRFLAVGGMLSVASVTTVILNMVLIPRFGAEGAAWANMCAYIVQSVLVVVLFVRTTHCSLGNFFKALLFRFSDVIFYKKMFRNLLP